MGDTTDPKSSGLLHHVSLTLDQLAKATEALRTEREGRERDRKEHETSLAAAEQRATDTIENLQSQLTAANDAIAAQKQRCLFEQHTAAEARNDRDRAKEKANGLLKELESERDTALKTEAKLKEEARLGQQKVNRARDSVAELLEKVEAAKALALEDRATLPEKIVLLKSEIQRRNAERQFITEELKAAINEKDGLNARLSKIEKELDKKSSFVKGIESCLREL